MWTSGSWSSSSSSRWSRAGSDRFLLNSTEWLNDPSGGSTVRSEAQEQTLEGHFIEVLLRECEEFLNWQNNTTSCMCAQWEVPPDYINVILSIKDNLTKDLVYILMAKGLHCISIKVRLFCPSSDLWVNDLKSLLISWIVFSCCLRTLPTHGSSSPPAWSWSPSSPRSWGRWCWTRCCCWRSERTRRWRPRAARSGRPRTWSAGSEVTWRWGFTVRGCWLVTWSFYAWLSFSFSIFLMQEWNETLLDALFNAWCRLHSNRKSKAVCDLFTFHSPN